MTRAEEKVLVAQAQQQPEQFSALYRAYVDELYRFIFHKTSSIEVAEDLTAQTFMHALSHLQQFHYQAGARFSSWLYTIARHQVIDYYRRQKPTADLEAIEPISVPETASLMVDQHLQQQRVQTILNQLTETDRELLQLRLWQDKAYTDIASIVGINPVAVRARYSRALKKFKQLFTTQYGQME